MSIIFPGSLVKGSSLSVPRFLMAPDAETCVQKRRDARRYRICPRYRITKHVLYMCRVSDDLSYPFAARRRSFIKRYRWRGSVGDGWKSKCS